MGYVELQLIVEGGDRVRARKQGGAEAEGVLTLPRLHQDLITIFDSWLREKRITRRRELQGFGSLLYASLFQGEIDKLLRQCLDQVTGNDRLRLQLVFRESAFALANIPWEFLYSPDSNNQAGFFFATHPKLVLSRYIPLGVDRKNLRLGENRLRVLAVISGPKSLTPVLAEPVIEAIRNLSESRPTDISTLLKPTINALIDTIDTIRPHVIHFVGHGRFDTTRNEGQIALLDEDDEAVWVSDYTFAHYFETVKPRLILLQSCQGGTIDFTNNFAGLAPQLIRRKVSAVVAMQYPVTNRTAISFARSFYQLLGRGEPIDAAVQYGRNRITMTNPDAYCSRDFGTPVLYMNSRDGVIMPSSSSSASSDTKHLKSGG